MSAGLRQRALLLATAVVVLMQICWPLLSGTPRTTLTIWTVIVFACVSVVHAALNFGVMWAISYTVITFVFASVIEAIGVSSGVIFGSYEYSGQLGARLFAVPIVIPIAWTMFAYLAWLIARTICTHINSTTARIVARIAIGAYVMTAWDVFLDPQMVSAGYWHWTDDGVALPGTYGIGIHNYLGWFFASAVLMLLLIGVRSRASAGALIDHRVPALLLAWTWIGGIIGNLFFFGRPTTALLGGIAMGLAVVPYLIAISRRPAAEEVGPA